MSSGFYRTVWRAVPNTTLCRPPFSLVPPLIAANDEHERALDLLDDGYRLENFRAAASDDRYHMVPPVWSALAVNPNHQAPLPVEWQAGREKGVRITKRKRSNGEFTTSSRTYALHVSNSQAQAEATPSLSQGLSQDPPQDDFVM